MTLDPTSPIDYTPKPEVYISFDVESNGPMPGFHSMYSFGACSFTLESGFLDSIGRNLEVLPGAIEDRRTMNEFWAQPENHAAFWAARKDPKPIKQAMHELDQWCRNQQLKDHKLVFVAGPAGFDWTYLSWYMYHAKGDKSVFYHACLDIRSYVAGMLKQNYRATGKGSYPSEWFDLSLPHTHVAQDDAIEQGAILWNAMRTNHGLEKRPFKSPALTPVIN
jgi:hypothetical protein